jgi:integrase
MGRDRVKTKHRGVTYRESDVKRYRGLPDRCYEVYVKGRRVTVGWASEGMTATEAHNRRMQLITGVRPTAGPDPGRSEGMIVDQAVQSFVIWAQAEGRKIRQDKARYDDHIAKVLGHLAISDINSDILVALKAKLGQRMATATVNACFAWVRRAINFAIQNGKYQGQNPFRSARNSPFHLRKPENAGVRFFTPAEAKELLAALRKRTKQVHDMSLLSLRTGLRATEILTLTYQDILAEQSALHVREKGGTYAVVPVPADVLQILVDYARKPSEYIFQRRGGGQITCGIPNTFMTIVNEIGFNAGLTDTRKRVWFHTWRHTFASWLAQSGQVSLLELMDLMRHSTVQMTMRYAHLIPQQTKSKLTIISDLLDRS